MAPRQAVGLAPGKLLVVGEHAVVHGRPAFALPVTAVTARVTATPRPGPLSIESEREAVSEGLLELARSTLSALAAPPDGLLLRIESSIPTGRGLGSSAAVATALARAIAAAYDSELAPAQLRALVHIAETHAHGRPSGVDGAAVVLGRPLAFQLPERLASVPTGGTFHFLIADSGQARNTGAAVAAVAAALALDLPGVQAKFDALGAIAEEAMQAWTAGDAPALGAWLTRAHGLLEDLGVSAPVLANLVTAALQAGALGAKLTGAGCGGCIIVLAPDAAALPVIESALQAAGAATVWRQTYGPEGS